MTRAQDAIALARGLKLVAEASTKTQEAYLKHLWANSSIRELLEQNVKNGQEITKKMMSNPSLEIEKVAGIIKEAAERTSVVAEGIKQLTVKSNVVQNFNSSDAEPSKPTADIGNLDISSITLKELETILSEHNKNREINLRFEDKARKEVPEVIAKENKPVKPTPKHLTRDEKSIQDMMNAVSSYQPKVTPIVEPASNQINLPALSTVAKQRKVPSSRVARMASFGGLFAGLGLGTMNELAKGALGIGGTLNVKEALLSPGNTERIVDTLCKVRGAALKLGQILSIQDSNIVSPQLIKAFDRVRQAADYMPDWQVQKVLVAEFGNDWRTKLTSFDEKPFAAASIGQVHRGVLFDGTEVAIKIQYPGVAKSIESDIDNLVSMLKVWDVFPPGVFIDNVVHVAKRELAWEVDYTREAMYTEKFAELIADYPEYRVPKVIKEFTSQNVITTELVPGVPMDQCFNLSEEHRNHIAECVMNLSLRELFVFRCMQTDPNWSNFLYDEKEKKLMLIDFGATRFYQKEFMDNYLKVIIAATENDRKTVLELSRAMGFLTGYETAAMEEAHVDAVLILGEVFSVKGQFDFGAQNTTKKIASLVPVMIAHRLCPPPEEIYSLHRKLSGVFLLCSRMKAKIACRPLFKEIVQNYKFD